MYGGNYITESRAVGTTAWRVSAGAIDRDGGELTAIAYCAEDPSLPLTEVSASAPVDEGEAATATTPPCPAGRALIAGGFSFGGSHDALFADGLLHPQGHLVGHRLRLVRLGRADRVRLLRSRRETRWIAPPSRCRPPRPRSRPTRRSNRSALIYVGLGLLGLALAVLFLRRRQVLRRRAGHG